jgi:hypothetical protein
MYDINVLNQEMNVLRALIVVIINSNNIENIIDILINDHFIVAINLMSIIAYMQNLDILKYMRNLLILLDLYISYSKKIPSISLVNIFKEDAILCIFGILNTQYNNINYPSENKMSVFYEFVTIKKTILKILLRIFIYKKEIYNQIDKKMIMDKILNYLKNNCFEKNDESICIIYALIIYIFIKNDISSLPNNVSIFNEPNIKFVEYVLIKSIPDHVDIVLTDSNVLRPIINERVINNENINIIEDTMNEILIPDSICLYIYNSTFLFKKLNHMFIDWNNVIYDLELSIKRNEIKTLEYMTDIGSLELFKYMILLKNVLKNSKEKNLFSFNELNIQKSIMALNSLYNYVSPNMRKHIKEIEEVLFRQLWIEYAQ